MADPTGLRVFMKTNWLDVPTSNANSGIAIVRTAVALIIAVHPIHGLLHPRDIIGFGEYLGSIGVPLGVASAWSIMFLQIASSAALILRRLVVPACIGHIAVLSVGIVLIHASQGWFVVGAGRNGMEFSFTLIACLLGVLWAHWPRHLSNTTVVPTTCRPMQAFLQLLFAAS